MSRVNDEIDFYCLNYTATPEEKNERRIEMEKKFNHFDIPINFYSGVSLNDKRVSFVKDEGVKRVWTICYGHLDMINHFVNHSDKEYAIFCEDDIIIHKQFIEKLTNILNMLNCYDKSTESNRSNPSISAPEGCIPKGGILKENLCKKYKFDLLLIGYLCSNPVDTYSNFPEIMTEFSSSTFKILEYDADTWGAQMYMISKTQAKILILKYYSDYALRTLTDKSLTPFSADWLITKDGKRALIYPLIVIENGDSVYTDKGQMNSRTNCFNFSYKPNTFI